MSPGPDPSMSVVIVTRDDYASIARPIRHLEAQTIRDRIELVVVAPSEDALGAGVEEAMDAGFHAVRIVEHGPIRSRGTGAASGVRAASAPIVGFVENHSFPAPGWAEALLHAHQGPWAVVGPAVENANPYTRTSKVTFLITYARWSPPHTAGEVELLPFHNSAYKREWLDRLGDRLGAMLDDEYRLQSDVRTAGGRLYLEPAARTAHTNETLLGASLTLFFNQGRSFGAGRIATWPGPRRAAYLVGSPAIPFMNLPRVLRDAVRTMRGPSVVVSLPSILLHLTAHGAGEAAAYLTKRPGDGDFLAAHEFSHRPEPAARA